MKPNQLQKSPVQAKSIRGAVYLAAGLLISSPLIRKSVAAEPGTPSDEVQLLRQRIEVLALDRSKLLLKNLDSLS